MHLQAAKAKVLDATVIGTRFEFKQLGFSGVLLQHSWPVLPADDSAWRICRQAISYGA